MSITIRQWHAQDYVSLLHMVTHCLEINYNAGADMQSTFKNAEALVQLGLLASQRNEPCLVADLDGDGPIGYTEWLELANPLGLDFRGRFLTGLGTYVMPPFQNQGVSKKLRDAAEAQGARLGFTKVGGVAYHSAGLQSVLNRGYKVAGFFTEKELRPC